MADKSLLYKISSEKALHSAWKKLNTTNPYSHGASGLTIEKFKVNLDEHIANISQDLRKSTYKFSPNRAVVIQKDNGSFRPLQVPEIKDRLVLKSIALELDYQFHDLLSLSKGLSFAYQKKLGIRQALEAIEEHYTNGKKVVLETDIVNFFGEVDKNKLLTDIVFPKLPDPSINELISNGLNQNISGIDKLPTNQAKVFDNVGTGIPQGNPLSPLLSNIYLSPFDSFMKKNNFSMVRYADDFVVMCLDESEAIGCFKAAKMFLLDALGLKLYELDSSNKTSITRPTQGNFVFLSICFNGEKMYPSLDNVEKFKNKIRSVCNISSDQNSVIQLLTKVKNRYEGWLSAFFFTDVDRYREELDYFIDRQLFLALAKSDWKFKSGSIGKVPHKYKHPNESADCLSKVQRQNSGVPIMATYLERIRNMDSTFPETKVKSKVLKHQVEVPKRKPNRVLSFFKRLFG